MQPAAIVFDLDGTLIDSAADVGAAVNRVLADEGLPALPPALTRSLMGEGGKVTISRAFALANRPLDEAALSALTRRFVAYYRERPAEHTVLYPEVRRTLEALRADGLRLAVCTNKFEQPARDVLQALGVMPLFDDVAGADTFAVRKPDPGHVRELLARMGLPGAPAVMVGDSIHDIHAGQGAGLPVIAVSWGYSTEPVAGLGADAVIDSFAEIPALLPKLEPRRAPARVS